MWSSPALSLGLVLLGGLLLASCGLSTASSAAPHQLAEAPPLPVRDQCMRGTVGSVADHLYRDHQNYRTISQALFPTEGDHSLIVWVDFDWWNGTSGLAGVRDSWAWSTSCLYVVLPLELFPLLSIWVFNPQQRMKEVTVSLPPFCANVTAEQANTALYLSIKRMEAYVRNRDDPDPDLSMAQCVVAFDGSGHMTPESDEAGLDKAYGLFYLNLAGIGLFMLALAFLAIQYIVDWANADKLSEAGADGYLAGNSPPGGNNDTSAKFGAAAIDGRGRPTSATEGYGSIDHQLYTNEEGHVVHVATSDSDDGDADDTDADEDYAAEESGTPSLHRAAGEMGDVLHGYGDRAGRSGYWPRGFGYETGATAAAAARRNSRHRLYEGEVVQIKGGLQRCRARILRLRGELGGLEADLALGTVAAASLRAAGQIKIANGEARVIEQEILLSEAEANMLEETGVCSLIKAKEMKYDFLMLKREMLDLKKRLWEVEKAAWSAEDDLRRRKQRSAVWENYLRALIGSPLLCDLLCAAFLAFLIDFYTSMLGPFAKSTVIPLFAVNLLCFVPWAIDFVRHRLSSLAFMLCCSCFLLCERRRAQSIVPPRDGDAMGNGQEANDKKANVWVLLPVAVVFVLHFAFFLTWIALATMFDFAYSLEIICLLVVMLFHLFMSVKLVLKIVRRIKDDSAEAVRSAAARAREETDYDEAEVFGEENNSHKDEARAAAAVALEKDGRNGVLARAFGWCPDPLRACLGGWVWFLCMMLCLLAALVIFLVWLHAGYHTFARQKTAGLQLLLTFVTLIVLLLERQIINLDISRRGYLRSFPRLVCRLAHQ